MVLCTVLLSKYPSNRLGLQLARIGNFYVVCVVCVCKVAWAEFDRHSGFP